MERSNANIIQNSLESMMTHHNRGNASFEEELKRKWSRLGNEISFAVVSAIYHSNATSTVKRYHS